MFFKFAGAFQLHYFVMIIAENAFTLIYFKQKINAAVYAVFFTQIQQNRADNSVIAARHGFKSFFKFFRFVPAGYRGYGFAVFVYPMIAVVSVCFAAQMFVKVRFFHRFVFGNMERTPKTERILDKNKHLSRWKIFWAGRSGS